ncbi:uncharacterized protein LOC135154626 [Lytechinus pictus]|uniref:uncharacterized protein LOC135154626 n=1 Tax=Lytechinus pictus TaxID=7653 RepID=UPI0030B9C704
MSQEQDSDQKKIHGSSGCWSEMKSVEGLPREEVTMLQGLHDKVREAAQEKAGKPFTALEPLQFATQIVAGTKYCILAYIDDKKEYVGVFIIYMNLTGDVSLTSFEEHKANFDIRFTPPLIPSTPPETKNNPDKK